jgi:hypothetical protein
LIEVPQVRLMGTQFLDRDVDAQQRAEVMGQLRQVGTDVRGRDETQAPRPLQEGSPLGLGAVVCRAEHLLDQQAAHAVADEHERPLANPLQLRPEQDVIGPVQQRHGETRLKEPAGQGEPAGLEGRVLVAQRPDPHLRQVLAEPSQPVFLGFGRAEPILARIAVEAGNENHIASTL